MYKSWIRITAALSSIDICFSFFADLSADGADHPVLLPHADIHDLQLLAVWSCGVRPHCWVCLFLYRCYVQPFSIGSRKLEYFTNKACLGHLCRKNSISISEVSRDTVRPSFRSKTRMFQMLNY